MSTVLLPEYSSSCMGFQTPLSNGGITSSSANIFITELSHDGLKGPNHHRRLRGRAACAHKEDERDISAS